MGVTCRGMAGFEYGLSSKFRCKIDMGRDHPFHFTDLFFDARRATGTIHAFNREGYTVFIFNIWHVEFRLKEKSLHYVSGHTFSGA